MLMDSQIQLNTIGEVVRPNLDYESPDDEKKAQVDEGCFNLNDHPRLKGTWKYMKENKSYILNYITIVINIIVFTILLSNTTDKVKELDGIVKGQRVLWNEFLGQFPNISSAYQQVVDIQNSMSKITNDIDRSSVQILTLNSINYTKLQSVLIQSDKVDPLNDRIELYNKILSHNISSEDFSITECPVIIVDFEQAGTIWYSDCVYQLCDNRLMRVLIRDTDGFSAKACVDDNQFLRYKNGILKYNMSVSLIKSQVGMKGVCQEPLYGSVVRDSVWIVRGQIPHETDFFVYNYPTWNYTRDYC